jgi:predicted nucleotidyltransferase
MNPSQDETIDRARSVLGADPRIRLALVFGSLARDRARPSSDLDVAVDMDRPMDSETLMSLTAELAAATGRPVDLIDLRTAGVPLLGEILKHGRRIVGGTDRYAALIRRHLFDEADFMPYYRRILGERRKAWIKI